MTQPNADPYAALGISPDATEAQVHEAYRRLAKRYHPDLHPEARAGQRMRTVNQAWATLSSPAARARYDACRSAPRARSASESGRSSDLRLGWASLLLALVVVWLVLVALFVGFVPPFLLGLVVLLSARGILGRA